MIRYGNKDYQEFYQIFIKNLHHYGVMNVFEDQNTLEKKSQELELGETNKKSILIAMDLYSKEKGIK